MVHKYLYGKKTTKPASLWHASTAYKNFLDNMGKVAILLILSKKCHDNTIIFESDDNNVYSDMKRTIYDNCPTLQSKDMSNDQYQILIEQSIVLIITSWECYFSDVIKGIFDDELFFNEIIKDSGKFEKFRSEIQLRKKKYAEYIDANNGSTNDLKFGTFLFENRKISCQRLDHVKLIFNTYLDYVNLEDVIEDKFKDIDAFFGSRHSIIHNQDEDILDNYNTDNVFELAKQVNDIIFHVDFELFSNS